MSFLNDPKLDTPPQDKPKRLSNLLRTHKLLSTVRSIPEIGNFRIGCTLMIATFGLMGYYFYRKQYEANMLSSLYHYKLTNENALVVNDQFYDIGTEGQPKRTMSWLYRVPIKEYNVLYRMKSALIRGQFDHDKEILFPREKDGVKGYDIITPFYYYLKFVKDNHNMAKDENGNLVAKEDAERAALAVNRGW